MPCFADLIPFMEKFTELKAVTMALKRLVEGSASGLGGQTNIDLKAPFIVLDTSRLSKEVHRARHIYSDRVFRAGTEYLYRG